MKETYFSLNTLPQRLAVSLMVSLLDRAESRSVPVHSNEAVTPN